MTELETRGSLNYGGAHGVQHSLPQVGTLRTGEQKKNSYGKFSPSKRKTYLFTSPLEDVCAAFVEAYFPDGTVEEWLSPVWEKREQVLKPRGFKVDTDLVSIPVLITPGTPFTQHHEVWTGAGCVHRCDGYWDFVSRQACADVDWSTIAVAPKVYNNPKREEQLVNEWRTVMVAGVGVPCALAPHALKKGRGVKLTTRASYELPDLRGGGLVRTDSHGNTAGSELPESMRSAQFIAGTGSMVRGTLDLVPRRATYLDESGRSKVSEFFAPVFRTESTRNDEFAYLADLARAAGGALPEFRRGIIVAGQAAEVMGMRGLHAPSAYRHDDPLGLDAEEQGAIEAAPSVVITQTGDEVMHGVVEARAKAEAEVASEEVESTTNAPTGVVIGGLEVPGTEALTGEQRQAIAMLRGEVFTKTVTTAKGKALARFDEEGFKDWLESEFAVRTITVLDRRSANECLIALRNLQGARAAAPTEEPTEAPSTHTVDAGDLATSAQSKRYTELRQLLIGHEPKGAALLANGLKSAGVSAFSHLTADAAEAMLGKVQGYCEDKGYMVDPRLEDEDPFSPDEFPAGGAA